MLPLKICISSKFFDIIKKLKYFLRRDLFVYTILVLEDDVELNQTITYALKKRGIISFQPILVKKLKNSQKMNLFI